MVWVSLRSDFCVGVTISLLLVNPSIAQMSPAATVKDTAIIDVPLVFGEIKALRLTTRCGQKGKRLKIQF